MQSTLKVLDVFAVVSDRKYITSTQRVPRTKTLKIMGCLTSAPAAIELMSVSGLCALLQHLFEGPHVLMVPQNVAAAMHRQPASCMWYHSSTTAVCQSVAAAVPQQIVSQLQSVAGYACA